MLIKNSRFLVASLSVAAVFHSSMVLSAPSSDDLEHCKVMSEIANAVMGARQAGVRMSKAMESASKGTDYWSTVTAMLVEEAYKEPIHSDEATKSTVADGFEDRIYASCLRTRDKK